MMIPAERLEAVREALRGDEGLGRLIQAHALARGFHLSLVGCNMPYTALAVSELVVEGAAARSGRSLAGVRIDPYELSPPKPLTFGFLAQEVLVRLIEPESRESGKEPIYFLDASKLRPGDEEAWKQLFQRVNEVRNRIIRELASPLVVLVPLDWTAVFATHAPDMWAVRSVQVKLAPVVELAEALGVMREPSPVLERTVKWGSGDVDTLAAAVEEARAELARRPEDTVAMRALGIQLDRLGDALMVAGDLAGAERVFQEGLALYRRLVESDPSHLPWRRDLSVSLNKVGDVRLERGDLEGAEALYQENLDGMRKLLSLDPDDAQSRRNMSVSRNKVGDVRLECGDLGRAEALYREGLEERRKLLAQEPDNAQWRRDLSVSLERVGDVHHARGDLEGAEALYQESLEERRKLLSQDPGNAGGRRDLFVSLDKVGDVRLERGDLEGAETLFQESLDEVRKLLSQDSGNVQLRRDITVSLDRIGDVRRARGDLEGAEASYQDSLEKRRELLSQDPGRPEWQCDEGVSLANLAQLREARGDFPAALEYMRQAMDIFSTLAARHPDVAQYRKLSDQAAQELARISSKQG